MILQPIKYHYLMLIFLNYYKQELINLKLLLYY
nr:MAG TPA: hypothetical protein [Caudoviricetes sp.]